MCVVGGGGDEEDGGQLDEGGVGASQSGQYVFFQTKSSILTYFSLLLQVFCIDSADKSNIETDAMNI